MRDLRLIGVHEDGLHLLVSDSEGERFRVPLDEPLRAAVRRDRPRLGQLQIEIDGGMRPREVQALIRAGFSAEDVADRAGWTVEKVRRYEGPIVAEREYVAGLARGVRLRGRGSGNASTPTLSSRVSQRLSGRGVDPAHAEWDSARGEDGGWTVIVTFPAGGRERQAKWTFDVAARTVVAADDEARWLSEDDTVGTGSPLPAPHLVSAPVRSTTVYDVEAEGGVQGKGGRRQAPVAAVTDEPVDLMTAMRERASHRGRPRRRKGTATQTPLDSMPREDALPLEDIHFDPQTMPPPPPARGPHPLDEPASADEPGPEASVEVPAEVVREVVREVVPELVPEAPAVLPVRAVADSVGDDVLPAADEHGDRHPGGREEPADRHQDDHDDDHDDDHRAVAAAKPRPAKKPARPSVPSWDDVMFGARPRD